jgi:hypothetical protein
MFKDPTISIVSPFHAILNDDLSSAFIGRGAGAGVIINTGFALDHSPVMEIVRARKAVPLSALQSEKIWFKSLAREAELRESWAYEQSGQ